jgi:photosystem II stability/assembly factor-like uncharacterized protein
MANCIFMIKITTILTFLLVTNISFAQSGWQLRPAGTNVILFGVSISKTNPNYVNAVGEAGKIFGSFDGGKTWWTQNNNLNYWLNSVVTIDPFTAVAVGFQADDELGKILKTTNGGQNWYPQWSNFVHTLNGVDFPNQWNGYAVGWFGTILQTSDGGETWERKFVNTNYNLYSVDFVDDNTGFIVGALGTMLKTTNSGLNWFNMQSPDTNSLHSVSFCDPLNGAAVGVKGIIITTTDGGETWVRRQSWLESDLNGVFMSNPYTITAVGNNSAILRSNNGGYTFTWQENPGPTVTYFGVNFYNAYFGITVGGGGKVLRTVSGGGDSSQVIGINPISNIIPDKIHLHQNYPNPFNPSTKINFDIPKNSFVTLKVYDMLGKEVALLVNQNLNAGSYDYIWEAKGFSSGVYIYRLETAGQIFTKRMFLIK